MVDRLGELVRRDVDRRSHNCWARRARQFQRVRPSRELVDAEQPAVGRRGEAFGHDDMLGDSSDLDHAVVEAGPEEVAAFAFDRGGDPRLAVLAYGPDEAAIPRRALGDVRHGRHRPPSAIAGRRPFSAR